MSLLERIDRLDLSLFDEIPSDGTSSVDRRSLLALHASLAARGDFRYLEVGSYIGSQLGASLQSVIVDPRCRSIVSIDRRDAMSADGRRYFERTEAHMVECLSRVPGADPSKLTTVDAGTDELNPAELSADLCFIDGEHSDAAALRDARFCRQVIRERGVIVFHDRTLVDRAIRLFLSELRSYCAYPLSHDLLVVELGVPSLLSDSRVEGQVPHKVWLLAGRFGGMRPALAFAAWSPRRFVVPVACARIALTLAAPRRRKRPLQIVQRFNGKSSFEISTFVTNDRLYAGMVDSFIAADFSPDAFVRLVDRDEDPYAAITRIGRESTARYPILCHQDVRLDRGAGRAELSDALQTLDTIDPHWVVAGTDGCTRDGRLLLRVVGRYGEPSSLHGEWSPSGSLPHPVVSLDEHFLVFNRRNAPSCSAEMSGFHLYGSDVCLRALASGGTAYVIDFPVTHFGGGNVSGLGALKQHLSRIWSEQFLFCYVVAPVGVLFFSRSKLLRRFFGSTLAVSWIQSAVHSSNTRTIPRRVGWFDRRLRDVRPTRVSADHWV